MIAARAARLSQLRKGVVYTVSRCVATNRSSLQATFFGEASGRQGLKPVDWWAVVKVRDGQRCTPVCEAHNSQF